MLHQLLLLGLVLVAAGSSANAQLAPGGGNMNLVDCANINDMVCPNSSPAPVVTFPEQAGSVSGSSLGCCKTNYLQCQNQVGNALCKTLATYTITPGQGNNEESCAPTTPDCTCQQALALERSMTLRFCPTPPVCCPSCECHGDPHCSAFDRSNPGAVWAVCDDRGSTCIHKNSTCAKTTYEGQPCVWTPVLNGYSECLRAPGTKVPQMTMYTKQYKSYFDSSDNTVYTFTLLLTLTSYGSISTIKVTDAGKSSTFTINDAGNCVGTSKYPLNSKDLVYIKDLPSGVWLQFQCMATGPKLPHRWDINFVKDPWYVPAQLLNNNGGVTSFAGFCSTGVISENTGGNPGGCRIMDRQISMYYGCNPNTPISNCKTQFCNKYAKRFTFPGLTGTLAKQCVAYVTDKAAPTNFIKTACALSKLHGTTVDPESCMTDHECKVCIDAVTDFPDLIADVLDTRPALPTVAPTAPCAADLVAVGLNRKTLSQFQTGVQVEFQATGGAWTGVFALLDEEVRSCGGCSNVLFVNGSNTEALALLNPGTYRIRQCFGVDTNPNQALCTGPPGYNATVTYTNPVYGGALSTPYGMLFNDHKLVCSATAFPKCPLNYQCCIWDRKTQTVAWEQCMTAFHGGFDGYASCAM